MESTPEIVDPLLKNERVKQEKKPSLPWSAEEDALIKQLVLDVGNKKWSHIAAKVR
jgi:hypothetical protein